MAPSGNFLFLEGNKNRSYQRIVDDLDARVTDFRSVCFMASNLLLNAIDFFVLLDYKSMSISNYQVLKSLTPN